MIRFRHFFILGLLALAGRLIRINERALGMESDRCGHDAHADRKVWP